MDYKEICEVYSELQGTTKGLEKTQILSSFLPKIKKEPETIYLLRGKIFPDYDDREIGISIQLVIKAISKTTGISEEKVLNSFKESGDLGSTAEELFLRKPQSALFSTSLTTQKVLNNLRKVSEIEGKGAIDKKIGLISELLNSAKPKEAKYIIRTIMQDLKIGVGDGLLRDSIVDFIYKPKDIQEKKEFSEKLQEAYDKATDFGEVFEKALNKKLDEIKLSPGKPVKVMLFPKAKDIQDAFRIVGKPAAFEYKYDGFRMLINKKENGEIDIFTRRLESVKKQFPDIIEVVKKNVKAKSFVIDCEAVGFDPKTKKFLPFQHISQRIKRKYEIEKLIKQLPVELKVFDILFLDCKSFLKEDFEKRRKTLKKVIKEEKNKISLAEQIITSDEKEAENFYQKALKDEQEGLMVKSLSAPYKPGARIGYAVKLKPTDEELDLVITGAEWGTGKRAGWLTSFNVSCIDEETGELLEIGKVSTGLKEKDSEEKTDTNVTYQEITNTLNKIKIEESGRNIKVKPEIVVSVQYQNIQKSPTYSSGFALRFPRIKSLRPDRNLKDITTLNEIEKKIKG